MCLGEDYPVEYHYTVSRTVCSSTSTYTVSRIVFLGEDHPVQVPVHLAHGGGGLCRVRSQVNKVGLG